MGDREIDQQLVERAQRGDKQAFDLLVIKYQRKLARLLSRGFSRRESHSRIGDADAVPQPARYGDTLEPAGFCGLAEASRLTWALVHEPRLLTIRDPYPRALWGRWATISA